MSSNSNANWPPHGSGGGSGTITGASNVGLGKGVFKSISGGNTLQFRSFVDTASIKWTQNTNDLTADFDLTFLSATAPIAYDNTTGVISYIPGSPLGAFMKFDNTTGLPTNINGWVTDNTYIDSAANIQLSYQPNNLAVNAQSFNLNTNVDPLQNSPNDTFQVMSLNANLDSAATGFNLGTSGDSVQILTGGFNYLGNGSTYGRLRYINFYSGFGNGTDPVTVKGLTGLGLGFNAQANSTIDGNVNLIGLGITLDAATVVTSNFSMLAISDFSQIPTDLYGYQGVVIQPNIATIKNNSGFYGFSCNPTITNFEGNSGFSGIFIGGVITNQSATGNYQGIQLNPNIVHLTRNSSGAYINCQTTDGTADWNALDVNTQAVNTTGVVRGLSIQTDDGQFAIDAIGHCNLSVGFDIQNGLGQQYGHVIGGEIRVPNGTVISSTDILANNMAFTVNTGDSGSVFNPSSVVSLTTLGFVGQIIGDGAVNGAVNFCLNGYADMHNGHIDRVNNFYAAAVPGGGTGTMDESVLFYGDQPFGLVATDNWGVRIESNSLENYLPKLAVGTANKKVTNASVGIELDSTDKAVLTARMSTAQVTALTALNGMWAYDSTLNKHQFRENGAWVGFLSDSIATQSTSSISANTTLVDKIEYFVDTSGGAVTLTLPAVSPTMCIVVKDVGGVASTNTITINPPGAETIDGAASFVLDWDYGSVEINSDNTNYWLN